MMITRYLHYIDNWIILQIMFIIFIYKCLFAPLENVCVGRGSKATTSHFPNF